MKRRPLKNRRKPEKTQAPEKPFKRPHRGDYATIDTKMPGFETFRYSFLKRKALPTKFPLNHSSRSTQSHAFNMPMTAIPRC